MNFNFTQSSENFRIMNYFLYKVFIFILFFLNGLILNINIELRRIIKTVSFCKRVKILDKACHRENCTSAQSYYRKKEKRKKGRK